MKDNDFTTTILVDQKPEEAFNAINNVRGWWLDNIEGNTNKLNDEFRFYVGDHILQFYFKIIERIPNKKIVWQTMDQYFNFTRDSSEWKDTKIIFEIAENKDKTQIRFTHQGLAPRLECYDVCSNAWSKYIQISLFNFIKNGKGQPNKW